MDPTTILRAMQSWPVEKQLDLLFRAWDQLIDSGWRPELTDEMLSEIERRLAEHEADPSKVFTWEQVVEHVQRAK